jgi:hypothetical protein
VNCTSPSPSQRKVNERISFSEKLKTFDLDIAWGGLLSGMALIRVKH